MSTVLILPLSILFGFVLWTLIFYWYVHPVLIKYPIEKALEPLILIHGFRYIGLMFLVPGVTTVALDTRFANPAAYGDLVAAILAIMTVFVLRFRFKSALYLVWIFNVLGFLDLVNAVSRGLMYTNDAHLGATFWIPATIVPLLLVTHGYIFSRLLMYAWLDNIKLLRPHNDH